MAFGLSFGAKSTKTSQTTKVDKTENLTGNDSKTTVGVQQGQQNTSSTGSQTTTGTTTGNQSTNQQQSDKGTTSQVGTTKTLGGDVTAGLSTAVKALLAGGINDANIANIANMIGGATGFNADQFVADQVLSARNRGENQLQEQNAAFGSAVGGTSSTNSMAALVDQRGRQDLEATLAGIRANATATAQGIRNQNLQSAVGAQGSLAEQAAGLGGVLKGAETSVDMKTLVDQITALTGTQQNTQNVNQNVATAEQSQTATTQLIAELVNALTNQSTHTVGTEDTKGKTKQVGGGASLSL